MLAAIGSEAANMGTYDKCLTRQPHTIIIDTRATSSWPQKYSRSTEEKGSVGKALKIKVNP